MTLLDPSPEPTYQWPLKNYVAAWSVHALTMTGLIWLLFAAHALHHGDYKMMWMWLGISLVVDTIDGPLARKARVTEVVPWFSGVMMDNVVDYMTWTLMPTLFMLDALPLGPSVLPVVAAILILCSSMFCYANTKMKSSDWYFVGFPAAWNIIAVVLWLFQFGSIVNWVIIILFTILALVPWKWVHPFRVKRLRALNATAATTWVVTTALWVGFYPQDPRWIIVPWGLSGAWILVAGAVRTWRGRPDHVD